MRKNNQGFIQIIVVILLLLVVAGAAYYFGTQKGKLSLNSHPTTVPAASSQPSSQPASDPTTGWRLITNKYWSFKSPSNLHYILCEPDESSVLLDPSITEDQKNNCGDDLRLITITRWNFINPIPTSPSKIPENSGEGPAQYTIVSDKKNILVDGKNAVYQKETTHSGNEAENSRINVYVIDGSINYIFQLNNISQEQLFDQILSTFKFTK